MKIFLAVLFLIVSGQVFGENKSVYQIKNYPFEEKTLKIEISKMWKEGWYPRGISSDGKSQVAVLYLKADFPLYTDWLLRVSSAAAPASLKQAAMNDAKNGWLPADITVAGGKTIYLFLKPKELIRIWEGGNGVPEIFTLEPNPIMPTEADYAPYALFFQNGKPCTFKYTPSGGTELTWQIVIYSGEAECLEGIDKMVELGYQAWGIEQNGGAMTVLFVKY